MKQVFATGAFGFIGRHLLKRLCQDGVVVRALVRDHAHYADHLDGVEVVVGDVQNQQAMKVAASGCDTVFHLAGKVHAVVDSPGDEAAYRAVNVEGTRNVLEGAAAGGARRFVFFSSVKVFGEEPSGCLDESYPPRPGTPYARSKLAAEQLVEEYATRVGFSGVSLRLPLVYGPRQKGNLARLIAAIDRGRFPALPEMNNRRSMLHIENLLQATLLVVSSKKPLRSCYVVADAKPYSTTSICEQLRRALGRPSPRCRMPLWMLRFIGQCGSGIQAVTRLPMPVTTDTLDKLLGSAWYAADAIARDLGYRPTRSFEDAVPELIAAYRSDCA